MYLIEVYVTNASLVINHPFTYFSDVDIEKYKRVRVNFGFNNYICALCISSNFTDKDIDTINKEFGYELKPILEIIDENPIITDDIYELAMWLSKTTVSPFVSCLNSMLPKVYRTVNKIDNIRKVEIIKKINDSNLKTLRQKELFNQLNEGMLLSDARKISLLTNKLIEYGAIEIIKENKKYINELINSTSFKELTNDQLNAYNTILNTDKKISLLFGVTGSGKTEVYLHLAREYLKQNKEVLILVPEISLTPQMIQRVKERFIDVVFYHSEMSDQERFEQYSRIKNNEVKIVVGTRSSIFLPFKSLGLIIIDEEHDQSYKQDTTPTYSCKNVAIKRAMMFDCKVVLASATPSLDSYTRALNHEYELIQLKNRINNMVPKIEIVDLNKEIKTNHSYILSSRLKEEIKICLDNNKQAIILLNRRGYTPIIKCGDCNYTVMCSDCDVPLNYHNDDHKLHCHSCGRIYNYKNICPKCNGNNLLEYGFGTQKVEEEVLKNFKNIKVLRMDRDTTNIKKGHEKILNSFGRHEADILIGTQMISKGLDYPDVTLVGILNADAGLMHQDYNASKMTFDLLMQAAGRSGRSSDLGKVIIQAYNPDHYVLKAVLAQDYNYFFNIEMNYRNKANYPPYSHFLSFIIQDINENRLNKSKDELMNLLNMTNLKVFKPVTIGKINKLNRIRILIVSKSAKELLSYANEILDKYLSLNNISNIKIDLDPLFLE